MTEMISGKYFLSLLFIMTSMSYLMLGIYTLIADIKSIARRKYMVAIIWLASWSLLYAIMFVSDNETSARFFWSIGFITGNLFFPAWVDFLIYVTDAEPKNKSWTSFLYAGSIIISVLIIASQDIAFRETEFGYLFSYTANPLFMVLIIFLISVFLIMTFLHLRWWYSARTQHEKKQLMRFNLVTFIIAPPGFFIEFIAPVFLDSFFVPIASVLVLLVSIQLAIIMYTYSSMSISVKNVSEDIFKSIPMPILLLDYENRIVHLNEAASLVWSNAFIGKNAADLFRIQGQSPAQSFFDQDFIDIAVSIETPSETKTYDMLLKILMNKHGHVYSKIVAFNDMTEVLGALANAEEASRAKSDFLSRMSHEIRTPMNAIIGMADIGLKAKDYSKTEYCLERIDKASKHLLNLINDILDMSKIEANKMEIKAVPFELDDIIARIRNISMVNAMEKKQNLLINVDDHIPNTLVGDDLRLVQVIANFISNATKFTPENGNIILNVLRDSPIKDDALTIRVEVIDNGIGINAEHYQKIFSSFEQAEGSIDRRFGGTGLGLAISKRIIELMGGSIGVSSEEGKGSCFYFTVNLRLFTPALESRTICIDDVCVTRDIDAVLNGSVILLAEDIEINREIVTAMLDGTGIIFEYAENGQIAVEKFKNAQDKYDLIFMDVQMPLMDGIEATKQIRMLGTAQAKNIPIIAMTANAFDEDVEKCKRAGMNDHIGKPINLDEVIGKLLFYLPL